MTFTLLFLWDSWVWEWVSLYLLCLLLRSFFLFVLLNSDVLAFISSYILLYKKNWIRVLTWWFERSLNCSDTVSCINKLSTHSPPKCVYLYTCALYERALHFVLAIVGCICGNYSGLCFIFHFFSAFQFTWEFPTWINCICFIQLLPLPHLFLQYMTSFIIIFMSDITHL